MGAGTDGRVWTLAAFANGVFAGGWFSAAGAAPSRLVGRWSVAPDIEIVPSDQMAFGREFVGYADTDPLTVRNTGDGDLVIRGISFTGTDAAEFSIAAEDPSGMTIVPGAAAILPVRFAPATDVSKAAVLHIFSNDPDESEVLLPLNGAGHPADSSDIGDIDCDGTLAVNDIIGLLRVALGLDEPFLYIADVNGDGTPDILDVVLLAEHVLGLGGQ